VIEQIGADGHYGGNAQNHPPRASPALFQGFEGIDAFLVIVNLHFQAWNAAMRVFCGGVSEQLGKCVAKITAHSAHFVRQFMDGGGVIERHGVAP
jgi:hypothetical protein